MSIRSKLMNADGWIICPVCGDHYNHIKQVYSLEGNCPSEIDSKAYTGTISLGQAPNNEDRCCLVVEFECESDHTWKFSLQQHEGITSALSERKS